LQRTLSSFGPPDILFPVPVALVASGSLEKPNLLAGAGIRIMEGLEWAEKIFA